MKNFFKKHTFLFVIAVVIVALLSNLITGFVQNIFSQNLITIYLAEAVCKCLISILPLTLMVKWGYVKKSNKKRISFGFALGTILILFCIPNLLPLTLVNPILFKVQWGVLFAIVLASFSIGLMEESAMRGVLLPLLCEKWQDKKHAYLKAAIASSLLFACVHLNWSVRYFLQTGSLSWEYFSNNLYQVYYTFCFGLFAAGLTIYTRSILPMIFWHGICDLSAFAVYGVIPYISLQYFFQTNTFTLQNVFNTYGILEGCSFGAELVLGMINLSFLIIGIIFIKKGEASLPKKNNES